ncbi:indole-3-glycerol phosphate synthase [Fibrobacterales bacterium]|nr:indole-3-glycerol phosphate synthase [Fibrobacterales bacterium]
MKGNFLEKIVKSTVSRVAKAKLSNFPFEAALKKKDLSFICEVKKASPSKGVIWKGKKDFPYLEIAEEYVNAGAAAISVLTEPQFFKGQNEYLTQIAKKFSVFNTGAGKADVERGGVKSAEVKSGGVPILRKDFIIDKFQIYEAKFLGASAVLLIVAILDFKKLKKFIALADELGLSALVEVHNKKELKIALKAKARVIGINNRNLKTFKTDLTVTKELCSMIPNGILKVSESGIHTEEDIAFVASCGVNGVLIGESFIKAKNKKEHLEKLRNAARRGF